MLEKINELLARDPFVPFQLVMSSGEKYTVTNPHMLVLGETQFFYVFPRSDKFAWLRYNQLVAVETVEQRAA